MKIIGPIYLTKIADEQFKILGLKLKFEDIPEDGIVTVGKKKDYWYNIYKFTKEQEKEWRDWAILRMEGMDNKEYWMNYVELRYGITLSYTKEGQLF